MAVTGGLLRSALAAVGAVGGQVDTFDNLAAGAAGALAQAPAGLTSAGAAAFLATCAEESAWWRTTTEYGRSLSYDPYRGRTFIQITWSSNYLGFGQWCRTRGLVTDDRFFVNNPAALSNLQWAWLGATWYMQSRGLWAYANAGNFLAVSQGVNGGNGKIGTSFVPNGWKERKAAYAVFAGAGSALLPGAAPTPGVPDGRRHRQQSLLL